MTQATESSPIQNTSRDVNARVNGLIARLQAESDAIVTAAAGSPGNAALLRLNTLLMAADKHLAKTLQDWAKRNGGDQAAFTAASAVAYRTQIQMVRDQVQGALYKDGPAIMGKTWAMGAQHATQALVGLEHAYTGITRTPRIREALTLDPNTPRGGAVLRSYATSVDRYGQAMIGQFEDHLAMGFAAGLSQYEMIQLLTGHGGPTGDVSMAAVVRNGQVVRTRTETIPEGLFVRYRYWAQRIVRTESANAYNAARLARLDAFREEFPDLKKKILAHFDRRTAWDSIAVHGQVRDMSGPNAFFQDGAGRVYEHPPARPNDRETVIPWRDDWGEVTSTAPLTQDEQHLAAQRIRAGQQPFDLQARRLADIATEQARTQAASQQLLQGFEPQLPAGFTLKDGGAGYIDVIDQDGKKSGYFKQVDSADGGPPSYQVTPPASLAGHPPATFTGQIEAAAYALRVARALQAQQAAQAAQAAIKAAEAAATAKAAKKAAAAAKAKETRARNKAAREQRATPPPVPTAPPAPRPSGPGVYYDRSTYAQQLRLRPVDVNRDHLEAMADPMLRTGAGVSLVADHDQFEGLEIRVRVLTDLAGREYYQFTTTLTDEVGDRVAQGLKARSDTEGERVVRPSAARHWMPTDVSTNPNGQLREIEPDWSPAPADRTRMTRSCGTSTNFRYFENEAQAGADLEVFFGRHVGIKPQPGATARHMSMSPELSVNHNRLDVRVYARDAAQALEHFHAQASRLGLADPLAHPTQEAVQTRVRAQILARYSETTRLGLQQQQDRSPAAIGALWQRYVGKWPDLTQIEETTSMVHGSDGGLALHSDHLATLMQQRLGADRLVHRSSPDDLERFMRSIARDPGGAALLSTIERWDRGMTYAGGMSSDRDMETGGAFGVFTRIRRRTDSHLGDDAPYGDSVIFTIDVRELGRLDAFSANGDRYGRVGRVQDRMFPRTAEQSAYNLDSLNETLLRGGVSSDSVQHVTMVAQTRNRILRHLDQQGITEIGGRPVAEFIREHRR